MKSEDGNGRQGVGGRDIETIAEEARTSHQGVVWAAGQGEERRGQRRPGRRFKVREGEPMRFLMKSL